MQLVNLLKKVFEYDGFILIDSDSKRVFLEKRTDEYIYWTSYLLKFTDLIT